MFVDDIKFCGIDDTLEVMRAKNQIATDGLLDRAFQAVLQAREPDAIRAHLVELAHASVAVTAKHFAQPAVVLHPVFSETD